MHGAVKFVLGAVTTVLVGVASHSWLGLGGDFIDTLESRSRSALGDAGGGLIHLSMVRDPALERVAILNGDANAETRVQLIDAVREVPGIRDARWAAGQPASAAVPLGE